MNKEVGMLSIKAMALTAGILWGAVFAWLYNRLRPREQE